jgi:hypothetical protein
LEEIATQIGEIRSVWFKEPKALEGLNLLARAIFSSKVEKLGFDYSDSDDYVTTQKRNLVISQAASAADQR